MPESEDYGKEATPTAHKTTHQDGGTDEISLRGLSGTLADNQPSSWAQVSGKPSTFAPETHKTSHQDGGTDEISVQGLSGLLADAQTPLAHKTSHQDGGTDEISVAGLSGLLADDQHVLDDEVIALIGYYFTVNHNKAMHDALGIDADTLDTYHAASFSLTTHNHDLVYSPLAHNHAGVYEPVIAAGTSTQYWRGDKSWQTLNQAAVDGLKTTDSPVFVTAKLSGLTDGYIPYHVTDAAGLANSPIFINGTNVGIGGTPIVPFEVFSSTAGEGFISQNSYAIGATSGGYDILRTTGTPTASGHRLGVLGFGGWDGAAWRTPASIQAYSAAPWDSSVRSTYFGFYVAPLAGGVGVETVRLTSEGNIYVGGTANRATTVGTKALQIFDGTTPGGTLTNGCSLYSSGGKLYAMDAAGNSTKLTP